MSTESDQIQQEFAAAQERWREAINAHRVAPPDAGFSGRLADLGEAAREEAVICRKADTAGFEWPPHTSAAKQPYELQTRQRPARPQALWALFDARGPAHRAGGYRSDRGRRAHELLADAAAQLADEVERQDRASACCGAAPQRRSA